MHHGAEADEKTCFPTLPAIFPLRILREALSVQQLLRYTAKDGRSTCKNTYIGRHQS